MNSEFDILYYINVYKRRWKVIVMAVGAAVLLAFFTSRFNPVTYVSSVTLIAANTGTASSDDSPVSRLLNISAGGSRWDMIISLLYSKRMATDIRAHFNLSKVPGFWWNIDASSLSGLGGTLVVRGNDPRLVQEIANFCVENLDKINVDLSISAVKPMVKVLDPAEYGARMPQRNLQKIFVSGSLAFLLISAYIFFSDYIRKLNEHPVKR